jgi:hypothetical protein
MKWSEVDISLNYDVIRVVYHGVTNSFFGIGILLVSDLLGFWYFGRYHSPLFVSFPSFFLKRGAELLKKGAIAPLLRKKGGNRPLFDTELYRPSFLLVSVW